MVEALSRVTLVPHGPLYRPLDDPTNEIRLFSFAKSESLSIDLHTIALEDRGAYRYVALSYEWGEGVSSQKIIVDNHETTVRENLYNFFHALRRHCHVSKGKSSEACSRDNNDDGAIIAPSHREDGQLITSRPDEDDAGASTCDDLANARYFWADALCINQADTEERGQQVGIMDTIYAGAKHVAVFLDGAPAQPHRWPGWHVDSALNLLRETFSKPNRKDEDFDFGSFLQHHHTIILPFFSLGYWERLWIIQEFALARDIVFVTKQQTLPLHLFEHDLIKAIRRADAQVIASTPEVFARKMHISPPGESPIHLYPVSQLPMLIHEHVDAKCRDPRDRIYAMLGLVDVEMRPVREEQGYHRWVSREEKQVERKLLMPDYTISPAELASRILVVVEKYGLDVGEFEEALYVRLGWDEPWAREVPGMVY